MYRSMFHKIIWAIIWIIYPTQHCTNIENTDGHVQSLPENQSFDLNDLLSTAHNISLDNKLEIEI